MIHIVLKAFSGGHFKNTKPYISILEHGLCENLDGHFSGVSESIRALPASLLMPQWSLILIHFVCQKRAICSATTIKDSLKQSSTLPSRSCNNKGIDGKKPSHSLVRRWKRQVKQGLDSALLITAAKRPYNAAGIRNIILCFFCLFVFFLWTGIIQIQITQIWL